jgi:thymidylate synthase
VRVIDSRNVNDAYRLGLWLLTADGVEEPSRAGPVLVMPTPIVNVYKNPRERVLFDAKRDANPFFHIVEAVWMIAGRRDATLLDRFVSDFSSRFAEDDGNAHGAYGYRWREHFTRPNPPYRDGVVIDQIMEAGRLLSENPTSRQVVMAMWDPTADLGAKKRDIPCNDLVMFRGVTKDFGQSWYLDMSIVARSHDAVWGAYGANFVHMTVMHEVVAALAGMQVGVYRHFSNNFHVYKSILPKIGLANESVEADPYITGAVSPDVICFNTKGAVIFIRECEHLCNELADGSSFSEPSNHWLRNTVIPMIEAHKAFKLGEYGDAFDQASEIEASDWQRAAVEWLERRIAKKNAGNGAAV